MVHFRGEIPKGDDLLVKEDIVKVKRCIYAAQVNLETCLCSLILPCEFSFQKM